MNQGMRTIIYPVNDVSRAKKNFRLLLGVDPHADQPYYVGFRIGDQEIGLDPNGHKEGMTGYYHVEDIKKTLQSLVEGGAQIVQQVKNVGGGKLIASVKDPEGNIIGLLQMP